MSLHECYRDACSRTMNFEVTVTFTHIILTAVTRKLSRYRNLKPYLYYPFYNILCERFLSIRQRYKAFLAESMFVIEQALSQDYLANYWCFLFSFFFAFNSTCMISSGNIEHSTGELLVYYTARNVFFFFGEQIITRSQKS